MPEGPLRGVDRPAVSCNITVVVPTSIIPSNSELREIKEILQEVSPVDIYEVNSASNRQIVFLPSRIERKYLDDFKVVDGVAVEFSIPIVPEDAVWGFEPGAVYAVHEVIHETETEQPFVTATPRGVTDVIRQPVNCNMQIVQTIPVEFSEIEDQLRNKLDPLKVEKANKDVRSMVAGFIEPGEFRIEDVFIVEYNKQTVKREDGKDINEGLKEIGRSRTVIDKPLHTDQVMFYRSK